MITTDKRGVVQANFTIIKDGVDLKKRFKNVLDEHPFTNLYSDAAKQLIATQLYDEVMKDVSNCKCKKK